MNKKLHNVYFKNSLGELRVIGTASTRKEAFAVIFEFLDGHNYKSYYQRVWKNSDGSRYIVDVGSHSEFFEIDVELMDECSVSDDKIENDEDESFNSNQKVTILSILEFIESKREEELKSIPLLLKRIMSDAIYQELAETKEDLSMFNEGLKKSILKKIDERITMANKALEIGGNSNE